MIDPKHELTDQPKSKTKTILVFIGTIILGFILFALPNVFFGVSKFNGGLTGINLAIIAIFQLVSVCSLIYFSLKFLNKKMSHIGLTFEHFLRDALIGFSITLIRIIIDFGLIIPNTGGAKRPDVLEVITALDGTTLGLVSLIILGVIGGGIAEEIYNRGFFINILKELFNNEKVGLWLAAILSILFFSAGHMPTNALLWYDIIAASLIYTALFLFTGRLTASIVAHGTWNMLAILIINYSY